MNTSPATRRALLAGAGVGAAALLAACTAEVPRTGSGLLRSSPDAFPSELPELAPLPEGRASCLEVPGLRYRVHGALRIPSFTRAAARNLGLLDGASDGDSEDDEVRAPEGEELLLVELGVGAAARMPPDLPEVDVRREAVALDGSSTALGEEPMPLGGTLRLILTVPDDAGAESPQLEVTCGDVAQRLNLEDGTRVSSDLEHWCSHWFRAVPAPRWIEQTDERVGGGLCSAGLSLRSRPFPLCPTGRGLLPAPCCSASGSLPRRRRRAPQRAAPSRFSCPVGTRRPCSVRRAGRSSRP